MESISNNRFYQRGEKDLREWLGQSASVLDRYDSFSVNLRRREIHSAYEGASETYKLLEKIIDNIPIDDYDEFMAYLRLLAYCLVKKQPMCLSISSVILQFIHIFDQQTYKLYTEGKKKEHSLVEAYQPSLLSMVATSQSIGKMYSVITTKTEEQEELIETIKETMAYELKNDINMASNLILESSSNYINDGDVILTYSHSYVVRDFITSACTKRNATSTGMEVICCETFPDLSGQKFAKDLAEKGIRTSLIHDAASFSVMSLCTKVIIGCHAVLANGGVLVTSGGSNLVMVASQFKVPVIVLTGVYKLVPQFCSDQSTINDYHSPSTIMPYSLYDDDLRNLDVVSPVYDYIPPEYVTIIVTTKGAYPPSYIYQLMKEYYSDEDIIHPLNSRFDKSTM